MSEATTLRAEIHATRRMLATYDETIAKLTAATGEVYAARGDAHEMLMRLESRRRSLVAAGEGRDEVREHYAALVEEAAAEKDQAQGRAEDFTPEWGF